MEMKNNLHKYNNQYFICFVKHCLETLDAYQRFMIPKSLVYSTFSRPMKHHSFSIHCDGVSIQKISVYIWRDYLIDYLHKVSRSFCND